MKNQVLDTYFKIIVIGAIVIYTLSLLKAVFAPLAMAMLLSLIVLPMARRMESWGMKRVLAAILSTLSIILIVGGFGVLVFFQFRELAADFPRLSGELNDRINGILQSLPDGLLPADVQTVGDLKQFAPQMVSGGSGFIANAVAATTGAVTMTLLIPVYMVFILLYRSKLFRFIGAIDKKRQGDLSTATLEAKEVAQKYLGGLGWVILIIAALSSTGLWLIGIEYALFFGVLSAMLTVIPYIGTTLGATLPVAFAILTKDSYWYAVGVAGMYVFVQFLEGNFITPYIVGRSVNINPLAAILALVLAAPMWGIIGMIIAIPTVAIIEIILQHSEEFDHFGIILRNEDP